MRVLARIEQPVESETPHGGQVVTYEPLGVIWLACGARRRRERTDGGQATRAVEAMGATCRSDARVVEGRVLRFGGADWALRGVEPGERGRLKLDLERAR